MPARKCIDRECEKCGVLAVKDLFKPLIEHCTNNVVKYNQWEQISETYRNKKGNKIESKRWVQSQKDETVEQVVDSVGAKIDSFAGHLFRADYQHRVETEMIHNLPMDQCLAVMDFSENISLQPQDEIESSHWTHKQVTLHPIFLVRHAPESTLDEPKIVKESLIIISDHLTHDADAVFSFTKQLLLHIQNNPGPEPVRTIQRFSDNCAAQYKCKTAFEHILVLENKYNYNVTRFKFQ